MTVRLLLWTWVTGVLLLYLWQFKPLLAGLSRSLAAIGGG